MKNIVLYFVTALFLVTSSCSTHYDAGMKAYREKDYPKAVKELSQVKEAHPNYSTATATLTKAEFRVTVQALRNAINPREAIKQSKKMVASAIQSGSKDIITEAFQVLLEELEKADNAAYLKEIVVSLITVIKQEGDNEQIAAALKGLALKFKDFLFNPELRGVVTDGLKKLKSLGSN